MGRLRRESEVEDVCGAVVDLGDHEVAGGRLVAAIGALEPDGGLFVVDRDGSEGGGGDGGGWWWVVAMVNGLTLPLLKD